MSPCLVRLALPRPSRPLRPSRQRRLLRLPRQRRTLRPLHLRRPLRPAFFSLQLELAVLKSSFSWSWLAKIAVQLELDAIFTVKLDLALLKSTFSWTCRGFMDTMV